MTVPALSEPSSSHDQFDLRSAQTLQELHAIAASILEPYQIDHAVLLCIPSPEHSLTLPLLPIKPELEELLRRAVNTNTHPAVATSDQFGKPKALSEFAVDMSDRAILAELMTAFCNAGMKQVYELPLVPRGDMRFILELARVDEPIVDFELAELQSLVSVIPGKLPKFLVTPPRTPFMDTMFHVR